MDFPVPIHLKDITAEFDLKVIGEVDQYVAGINEINKVRVGDMTFVDHPKYYDKVLKSLATYILINTEVDPPKGKCLLVTERPFDVYNELVARHHPRIYLKSNVHPTAQIHPTAVLEQNVVVGAYVTVGADSYVRANSFLGDHTKIGDRVMIEPNVIIGSDAFYFQREHGRYRKWCTGGRVLIEDDVYIGSGCSIARGVSGDTIIGSGSKLDALIQIGHGVVIGKNCLLAAQVGIAGKTILGDRVTVYGQAGISQRLHIGDDCIILAKSGVSKNLEAGKTYFGYPAQEAREQYKQMAKLKKILDSDS